MAAVVPTGEKGEASGKPEEKAETLKDKEAGSVKHDIIKADLGDSVEFSSRVPHAYLRAARMRPARWHIQS